MFNSFNSSTMTRMVDEVIRDHDLPYDIRRIFEPQDQSWTWCGEFAELTASTTEQPTFEICVRWPHGSNYESVKADLTRQLVAHVRR